MMEYTFINPHNFNRLMDLHDRAGARVMKFNGDTRTVELDTKQLNMADPLDVAAATMFILICDLDEKGK